MDFTLPDELAALRKRVRAFVDEKVAPAEAQVVAEDAARKHDALKALQAEARAAGLWTPHLAPELGGLGLGLIGMCALFREMGRSPIGAKAFNCDAPNQGNMDLLAAVASPSVRERWLAPLCAGEITSAFCMTEPAPGAGADPTNLLTRAERDGDGWRIRGHKWYSTGGGDAAFLIVMARTSDDPRTGASLFVVDRHAEGVEHVRDIPVMAPDFLDHREAELVFHDVRVGDDAVLAGVGEGFRLAQRRLVPARLSHCMRWLGLADRALELCREYVGRRVSFGRKLADHQLVQKMVFEAATAIHAGSLMTWHCAWMLESGRQSPSGLLEQGAGKAALPYSSMAKTHVARALCKTLDDAIQMHGALGYSEDLPFSRWYRSARAARIADGPDEVHEVVVAREALAGRLVLI